MNRVNYLVKILAATVMLMALPPKMRAQDVPYPCQSVWTEYDPIKEESSIVRSDNYYRVVHVQHNDPSTGMRPHTFIIKSIYTGLEVAVTTYFSNQGETASPIDITDMRMHNGECYFCGTLHTGYVDYNGSPVTHGIVGHFSPQAILNASGYVTYYIVEETSRLTRLAINLASNQRPLVSAIGYKDNYGTSCMVELKQTGIMSWSLRLNYLESPDDINFADILYAGDSITLLSQMKCANNYPPSHGSYDTRHQIFMLDRFSKDGCYNDCSSGGMHYMAHYYIDDASYCKFHPDGYPMLLCHVDGSSYGFGAAYGVDETVENTGGIRLFPFNHAWKYDSCIYYRTGKSVIVKDIGNLFGTGILFLVSIDASHGKGVITLPKLGSATHDVPFLIDPGNTHTYNSVSWNSGTVNIDIDITGHDEASKYTLFQQNITNPTLPSCFNKPNLHYEVFSEKRAAMLVVKWKSELLDMRQWEYPDIEETVFTTDWVCRKCGEE